VFQKVDIDEFLTGPMDEMYGESGGNGSNHYHLPIVWGSASKGNTIIVGPEATPDGVARREDSQ
jgi:hypothetical protein